MDSRVALHRGMGSIKQGKVTEGSWFPKRPGDVSYPKSTQ